MFVSARFFFLCILYMQLFFINFMRFFSRKILFFLSIIFALGLLVQPVFAAPLSGADADVGSYWHYDGLTYTDDTADANSSDTIDTQFFNATGGAETIYMGHASSKFTAAYFDVSIGTGSGEASVTIEYWNGSSWTSSGLSPSNNTTAFGNAAIHNYSFTAPSDWAKTSVNGEGISYYYIRMICDSDCAYASVDQVSLLLAAEAVPEFSDMMYMMTLALGIWYVYRKMQRQQYA